MKYDKDETPKKAEEWAKKGLSNLQIAYNLGISEATIYEWLKEKTEFSEAIKRGKAVADFEVENALYKLALGMEYTEDTQSIRRKKNGKYEVTNITKNNRKALPNYKAIEFWLRNRKPNEWGNIEQTPETKLPIVNINVTDNKDLEKEFESYESNT